MGAHLQSPRRCVLPYQTTHHLALQSSLAPFPGCSIKALCHQPSAAKSSITPPSGATTSIAPSAIRHNIEALRSQSLGVTSRHCSVSHWAQYQSIPPPAIVRNSKALCRHQAQNPSIVPPSGAKSKHRAAISKRCATSGMMSRHCAAIMHDIQASCHQPSGATSKHRAAIRRKIQALRHHQVQNPSIALPSGAKSRHRAESGAMSRHCTAIRHKIQASCNQPPGATSRHRTAIRRKIQALRRHQAKNPSIAPPAIGGSIKASCCHQAQNPSIMPPSGAKSKHCVAIRHKIMALRHQP